MDLSGLVEFVRAHPLGVVATADARGRPEAALVGIAATDEGELIFDTSSSSRKYANLGRNANVALVVGWDDEVTVQCEGAADVLTDGPDADRCREAYLGAYPDGRERSNWPDVAYIRIKPTWIRYSDYRPASFTIEEGPL